MFSGNELMKNQMWYLMMPREKLPAALDEQIGDLSKLSISWRPICSHLSLEASFYNRGS